MDKLLEKRAFFIDMDGVVYHGNKLLDGVREFVEWLEENDKEYIFLTNSPERTPEELSAKLARMGLNVTKDHFYTSAFATASFLKWQSPNASVHILGGNGLYVAMQEAGFTINDVNPDYVIVGETVNYNFELITKAVQLIMNGAKFIATNPDLAGPMETGLEPGCRAMVAPIEMIADRKPYYIGKPNPIMMRYAQACLKADVSETVIIGDRMDTDVIAGIESGLDTVLVLSGVTDIKTMNTFPYRPHYVLNGVGDIPAYAKGQLKQ